MAFFSFLLKGKFYLHLLYAVILTIVLLFLVLQLLKIFTHHNEAYIVPDFSGYSMQDIEDQNFNELFDFTLTDSIYNNDLVPGSIIMQNPSPGSKVKKGRNIYITIVAFMPEMTTMPELKDLSLRQAMALLKLNGLKVNRLRYRPHMAENAVIGQYINEDTLWADTAILKGSSIDLILGQGRNIQLPVPFLVGQEVQNAHDMINLSSFNVGREYFLDEAGEGDFRVYRQSPGWKEDSRLYRGDYVNVWYRSDENYNFDSLIDVLRPDTTKMDSLNFKGLQNLKIDE